MKRITILGIVLLVIAVLWSGAWIYASAVIRQQVTALASADGETSPKLVCDRLDIGGYPFWFDVSCGGMRLTSGDTSANLAELKATLLVYEPWHVLLRLTSPLNLEDAFTGSRERLDWKSLEASASLTSWRIARISIVGSTLALTDTLAADVPLGKASDAEFHLLDVPSQYDAAKHLASLALYAKIDDLNAPGLSVNDGKATLDGVISGLPDDVRTYDDPNLLQRWQQAGGALKLAGLKGSDGDQTSFDISGNLALDARKRPAGQLSVKSKGLVERLGTLVPQQWRGVVLGSPAADGSYSQVINLTNGVAFSGLMPLGPLPSLY